MKQEVFATEKNQPEQKLDTQATLPLKEKIQGMHNASFPNDSLQLLEKSQNHIRRYPHPH